MEPTTTNDHSNSSSEEDYDPTHLTNNPSSPQSPNQSDSEIDSNSDSSLDSEGSYDEGPVDDSVFGTLLSELKKSFNLDESDTTPRHRVPPQFSQDVVEYLASHGPLLFMQKYILKGLTKPEILDLLAAFDFNLPISICEDPQYDQKYFEIALQIAITHTMKTRRRLPTPRTLDEVVETIKNASKIMVVTGAGISTSLGIPDFRSDDGLYAQLAHLGLDDPQDVFDISTFKMDPHIFYSVAQKILPEKGLHSGTPTHKFIKLLYDHNKLLRNYTQNIDNLEHYVGIPYDKLVQCHGSFGSAHCVTCGYEITDGEVLFPEIKEGKVPRCPECVSRTNQKKRLHFEEDEDAKSEDASFGVLKPDITFFGESLPPRFDHLLFDEKDARNCDLLLCLGTSLRVSPVSEIVKVVSKRIPQIYISRTRAKHCTFEVEFLGDCDDVVELLCQKLGWKLDHKMAHRPESMPDDKFPRGDINYDDGVFVFTDKDAKSESRSESPSESPKEEIKEAPKESPSRSPSKSPKEVAHAHDETKHNAK